MQRAVQQEQKQVVREALLTWYVQHRRDLPWRRTRDPYHIWLSEIMLQQTRVAAVIPYYQRFLQRFPDVASLAAAPEQDLLAAWAGLGYYSRARNLQRAARSIVALGQFPNDYAAIRDLPGVGDYTAAAVASIAFNLPHAVLDGNVFRVLSRIHADGTDIASAIGRKRFAALANDLLDQKRPAEFNQAVMELGATVCLPKNPQCLLCPVKPMCRAAAAGTQNEFPVKLNPQKQVSEARRLFWIERDGSVLAWQRDARERLMAGFWELPERLQLPLLEEEGALLASFKHSITFHNYTFQVVKAVSPQDIGCCKWLPLSGLRDVPVSTVFKKAVLALE